MSILLELSNNASYLASVVGFASGVAGVFLGLLRRTETQIYLNRYAEDQLNEALISADRVLKNGATPPLVRKFLLSTLNLLASPDVGRDFVTNFLGKSRPGRPGKQSELTAAIDKLHVEHPALGADVHKALMGVLLAVPIIYGDKTNILEMAGEGATNPESVFDRAMKAISKLNAGGPPGAPGGGALPAF